LSAERGDVLDSRFRGNDKSRCSRMLPGAGVSPGLVCLPPRMGDRGLRRTMEMVLAGAGGIGVGGYHPPLRALDSRFRGNDRNRCSILLPGAGVSPVLQNPPGIPLCQRGT
jgi:hypothetical protein